jgi:hypothetical protein
MSTTTSTATPAKSSLATSAKFRTFAVAIGIAFPVIYLICERQNWPLFTFHPATNRIVLGWEASRSGEGPAMYWYGWTVTTLILGSIVGIIATMLPESVTKKIPLFLLWLLPILALIPLAWSLMPFWTHR